MRKIEVRTVSMKDPKTRATWGDTMSLDSSAHRLYALNLLAKVKAQRERELQVAESASHPNMTRIASLRAVIQNLTATLNRTRR